MHKFKEYLAVDKIKKGDIIFTLITTLLCAIIFYMPTGFEGLKNENNHSVKSIILYVDNTAHHKIGLLNTGVQYLRVRVTDGKYKNMEFDTINNFLGKLELDKFYSTGDKVFSVIETDGKSPISLQVVDRYRLNYELFLILIFCLFLIFYGGFVGIKSIISFFFSALLLWKVMLPLYLKGWSPVPLSLAVVGVLTFIIIFLIAGFNKNGLSAFLGSISGVIVTAILSMIFGALFKIPGEIKPFAETLLYAGFGKLNFSDILLAGIFISNSGAIMDISIDISTAMQEIKDKKPEISLFELILSGITIGRAVTGTMTTTLLLAYSGGYSTLLMVFIATGVPVKNILNLQYISSEILHTMVGSFGLILVAPLTAVVGGFIFSYKKNKKHSD